MRRGLIGSGVGFRGAIRVKPATPTEQYDQFNTETNYNPSILSGFEL